MKDEQLRAQINALIKDEIQDGINDYIDTKEESEKSGLGLSLIHISEPTRPY